MSRALRIAGTLAVAVCTACGGGSPTSPGPTPPLPPPNNAPPIIDGIAVERQRLEAGETTTVTATVRDNETPVNQLTYQWTASAGSFSGGGATVTWRAPEGASTPENYALTLTVIESYGTANAQGVRPEHRVTATSPVRVHDSPRELGELALRFLADFANSSVSADDAVKVFSDACSGKAAEHTDIENNRRNYDILSSSLDLRSVNVAGNRQSGSMVVDCAFTSRVKQCPGGSSCAIGSIESVAGECRMTAVYEQDRWWLCDSTFHGVMVPSLRLFFGAPAGG